MSRKPRSADPEARQRVLDANRCDILRDQKEAARVYEKSDVFEAVLLKAREDVPHHRLIERELHLAYYSRLKRLSAPVSAGDRGPLLKEITELRGLIWGEWARNEVRKLRLDSWSDEFWQDLRNSGVSLPETNAIMKSLVRPARGRPITKQPIAVKALQLQLAGRTWRDITNELCDCGKRKHDARCQEVIRQSVITLKRTLRRYGIDVPNTPVLKGRGE